MLLRHVLILVLAVHLLLLQGLLCAGCPDSEATGNERGGPHLHLWFLQNDHAGAPHDDHPEHDHDPLYLTCNLLAVTITGEVPGSETLVLDPCVSCLLPRFCFTMTAEVPYLPSRFAPSPTALHLMDLPLLL